MNDIHYECMNRCEHELMNNCSLGTGRRFNHESVVSACTKECEESAGLDMIQAANLGEAKGKMMCERAGGARPFLVADRHGVWRSIQEFRLVPVLPHLQESLAPVKSQTDLTWAFFGAAALTLTALVLFKVRIPFSPSGVQKAASAGLLLGSLQTFFHSSRS